jgi:hypothetical protein
MGTTKYLDSILRILPAVQARQISDLLNDLQAKGTVRNAEEYREKLQELSTVVNSDIPKPSFEQIRALVWNLCSSEAHNVMMQSFKNDIEASFLQVDEIGKKLDEHNELLMRNMIADLERGLNEQSNRILSLEWLADQSNEFTQVLVNSFVTATSLKVPRSELGADSFYFDNRTYKTQTEVDIPSAVVSERGEKLILDTVNDTPIQAVGIKETTDEYSYNTTINVDVDNDIENIIDGKRGTFWFKNVYLESPVAKVSTVLQFDFGVGKDIDYVIVEGATQEPFFIDSIEGIASDGSRVSLLSVSKEVEGKTRVDFDKTFLQAIKISFSVKTYHKQSYWTPKESNVHDAFIKANRFKRLERKNYIAPVSRKALASEKLAKLCNVPVEKSKQINSYKYTFGLDNVWFGGSLYKDSGIFVSKPLKVTNIGVLGIKTDETTETGVTRNTIECEIIKIDRKPFYKETRFPVLKIDEPETIIERLIPVKRETEAAVNDVGMLRFCPYIPSDWTTGDTDPIIVYENGVALTIDTDWEYAFAELSGINKTFDWKTDFADGTNFSLYTLSPPKVWIKLKNAKLNSVYTVSYKPRTSDYNINIAGTNEQATLWLDKDETVFLNKDGRIQFKRNDPDVTIESDIYLQITLRRNKPYQSVSPELLEYSVLATSYD